MIYWLATLLFLSFLLLPNAEGGEGQTWEPSPSLFSSIQLHEGYRSCPYQDTLGNWTIGFGHEIADESTPCWTREYAHGTLYSDLLTAHTIAVLDLGNRCWQGLSPDRQNVLVELSFQLGGRGLSAFHKMIVDLCSGKYLAAAQELKSSLLAREAPFRTLALANRLETN